MSLWLFLRAIGAIDSKLSGHTVESRTQRWADISVLADICKQNSPDFCQNSRFFKLSDFHKSGLTLSSKTTQYIQSCIDG